MDELQFLCNELSTWLSALANKEISSDLVNELYDGIVNTIRFFFNVGFM